MKTRTRAAAIISLAVLLFTVAALPICAADTTTETKLSFWRLSNIIPLVILLAIIIALVVVFFILPKRRERTLKFFRGLKSESKKVSWFTWKQTWRGTMVVAIISIVIATVIGLLDVGFSQGLNAIARLFR